MAFVLLGLPMIVVGVRALADLSGPHRTAPARSALARTSSQPTTSRASATNSAPVTYEIVGRRNLFGALKPASGEPAPPPKESATVAPVVAQPAVITRESQRHTPESDKIAFIGIVTIDGMAHAVIENFGVGETRFVRVADEAFGYRIKSIEHNIVVLERDGNSFSLELGDNKPESRRVVTANANSLSSLPANLQEIAMRLLPPGGEIRRVRSRMENGQLIYEVMKVKDGLDYEVRLSADGRVLRTESEMRHEDLPAHIATAANNAIPGYTVNPRNPPTLHERDGQKYYEVEVRNEAGREVDVRIAPDGTLMRRN